MIEAILVDLEQEHRNAVLDQEADVAIGALADLHAPAARRRQGSAVHTPGKDQDRHFKLPHAFWIDGPSDDQCWDEVLSLPEITWANSADRDAAKGLRPVPP